MNKIGTEKRLIKGRGCFEVTCLECGFIRWPVKHKIHENMRCPKCSSLGGISDRILKKIVLNNIGCHEWVGTLSKDGYAIISYKNKRVRVAKYVLENFLNRKLKNGYETCHTCDNRKCVNINHLYEGTHKDNGVDLAKRGILKGEKNPSVIITEKIAKEIINLLLKKESNVIIARKFKIPKSIVNNISSKSAWKWLWDKIENELNIGVHFQ